MSSGRSKRCKEPERLQEILENAIRVNEQFELNPWQANFDVKAINGMMNGIIGWK